ncbi:hypothetical protein STANM309S_05278 [Streptomyces tanashiensis]
MPEPSDEPALTWRGRAETVLGAVTGAAHPLAEKDPLADED